MKKYNVRRTLLAFFVLYFISLSSLSSATAQQLNLDSLFAIWNDKTQPDTIRLKAIFKIARDGYLFNQPDSAFYFAQLEYDFAQRKGLKKYMADALRIQGGSFWIKGENIKALDYFKKTMKIKEEINDKNGIGKTLGNMGLIYWNQGDYPKALEHYQRSLNILEEIGDKNGISNSLNNIGTIYDSQNDYPKALEYYRKSLKISEETRDKKGIAGSLINIGLVYSNQGDYTQALDNIQKGIVICEGIGEKQFMANALFNIGLIYRNQFDYHNALDYSQRSLIVFEEIGDKNGITNSLISMGNLYLLQGDPQKAIKECNEGLQLAEEIGAIMSQKGACKCLYDTYKATGNGNKALGYHEQMLVLDDSLKSEETGKKLQQMEFAKQVLQDSIATAEKERLVAEAHKEEVRKKNRTRNYFAGAGLLFLLLAGGLYSRVRYIRKSKAVLQVEKDRSENLLLNILPEEIAAELKEKGRADARDFDRVSILFTDFKGFTEASAKLSAQDLVLEINTCFEAFDAIIEKYHIEKIKTIGDAYMAAGGLPVPTDDSVKNTVLAALEMQEFISKRKAEQDALGKPAFEMRVGIHTGPVVAGIVGVKKFQYDIWGDTVNTASRMESSGAVGNVNISQSTYELIMDDAVFAFESRGKIEAKGKGEMEMLFVSIKK